MSSPDRLFRFAWKTFGAVVAAGCLIALHVYSGAGYFILGAYVVGWVHTIWTEAADA